MFFWAYRYAKSTSSWMLVLISLERFVAVWFPIQAKKINTNRNAYIATALVYCILACYVGYWCSWADQIINGVCIPNTRPKGKEHLLGVLLVTGMSLYACIPAVMMLVCNVLIAYKLFHLRRNSLLRVQPTSMAYSRQEPTEKIQSLTSANCQELQKRTTHMLIGAALVFVVLVIPNAVSHLVGFIRKQNIWESTDPGMIIFREISQVMEQMNNSINFFLYVLCSQRFRKRLLQLCGGRQTDSGDARSLTRHNTGHRVNLQAKPGGSQCNTVI